MILGVIEWGYAIHERLSVTNMSLGGARTGSGQGDESLADYYILRTVAKAAGAVSASEITSIVVYKATGPSGTVPTACKSSSVPGTCNHYAGADLANDATQFGCVGPPGPVTKIDGSWCATDRKTALSGNGGPPDYLGVYVEATHPHFTSLFGSASSFNSNTIIRIEPRTET